jgi:hypothetical protein
MGDIDRPVQATEAADPKAKTAMGQGGHSAGPGGERGLTRAPARAREKRSLPYYRSLASPQGGCLFAKCSPG